ncbi:MAG TPA: hypothetical protein VEX88_08230 [Glaciibacter sp.]|nr:hypothetical protein [Glaciibacter sp.]
MPPNATVSPVIELVEITQRAPMIELVEITPTGLGKLDHRLSATSTPGVHRSTAVTDSGVTVRL